MQKKKRRFVVGDLLNDEYDHRSLRERERQEMMMNVARIMIVNNGKWRVQSSYRCQVIDERTVQNDNDHWEYCQNPTENCVTYKVLQTC